MTKMFKATIERYNPDKDDAPHMETYDVEYELAASTTLTRWSAALQTSHHDARAGQMVTPCQLLESASVAGRL